MLLSLVFAIIVGGGPVAQAAGVPVDPTEVTAATTDEDTPVAVPPASEKAMAYYEEFVRQHAYGLSNQTLGKWWADTLKSLAVGCIIGSLVLLASFYAAYRTAGAVLARWGPRFGFTTLADIASLPLILLLISAFSLIVTPLSMAFTRHNEHEADRFGLEIIQASHSAGTAFVKLQEDALANPRPGLLFKLWRASHPPLGERIDFVNDYHPWRDGRPLVYADRFKK